jgi:hypothetical protein
MQYVKQEKKKLHLVSANDVSDLQLGVAVFETKPENEISYND